MKRSSLWDIIMQVLYHLIIGSNLQVTLHLQQELKKIAKRYLMSSPSGANGLVLKLAKTRTDVFVYKRIGSNQLNMFFIYNYLTIFKCEQ